MTCFCTAHVVPHPHHPQSTRCMRWVQHLNVQHLNAWCMRWVQNLEIQHLDEAWIPGLQIRAHNLEPALHWVEEHRQELQRQPQAKGFEFKLYRLSFLNTLQQQGVMCSSCFSFGARHAFMVCAVFTSSVFSLRKQTRQDFIT